MSDEHLVHRLVAAARAAFTHARERDPGEHFYCYAFFAPSGQFTAIFPTCNNERDHQATFSSQGAAEEDPEFLRWNPADWPNPEGATDTVAEEMSALNDILTDRSPDPDASDVDDATEAEAATRYEACVRALETLDEEGFFGTGPEREQTILAVLSPGVSAAEEAESVHQLNPQAAIDRFFPDGVWEGAAPIGDPLALDCPPTPHVSALAYSHESGTLLACGPNGDLFTWDLTTGEPAHPTRVQDLSLWRAAISSDGSVATVAGSSAAPERTSRTCRVDPSTHELTELCGGGDAALALSADGRLVATSDYAGTVRCVDVATSAELWTVSRPSENIARDLQFSPDATLLSVGGDEASLIDVATGEARTQLTETQPLVHHSTAWSPDGSLLAVADSTNPGVITIHTVATLGAGQPTTAAPLTGDGAHPGNNGVNALCFSPDSAVLASVHTSGDLNLWNAAGEHLHRLRGWQDGLNAVVFLDSDEVVAAGDDIENASPIAVWTLGPDPEDTEPPE